MLKNKLEWKVQKKKMYFKQEDPRIGDDLYIPSRIPNLYEFNQGEDVFIGGLCKIIEIEEIIENGEKELFVKVKENPKWIINWNYLSRNQNKWRKEYGSTRGRINNFYWKIWKNRTMI